MVFYLYVVDERRHLVGVVSLRRLLLVPPDTPLKRIMTTEVYSARVDTDQEEVARQVASYNLLAIPVVDAENKLVGVITVDDVIDVIKDEATEDVFRLAGVSQGRRRPDAAAASRCGGACRGCSSTWSPRSWRRRSSACSPARSTRWSRLAMFMPVVAGMGGNAATQTLAVIVRGIALGELTWSNARQALIKEGLVGLGNGLANGLVGGDRRLGPDARRLGARADPDGRDDHQHVRRGHGRHADSARSAGAEGRPGAGLVGVHHDASPTCSGSSRSSAWRRSSCGSCTYG